MTPQGGRRGRAGPPAAASDPLEAALGYRFKHPALLRTALIHRSYLHDVPEGAPKSNERLEFLGDAVLGFLVARRLYLRYPDKPEGELTACAARWCASASSAPGARRSTWAAIST